MKLLFFNELQAKNYFDEDVKKLVTLDWSSEVSAHWKKDCLKFPPRQLC